MTPRAAPLAKVGGGGAGGLMGKEGATAGGGVRWDNSGGQQWGCLQPLRTTLYTKYKSPKQFEVKQSFKALRALTAGLALPI